MIFVPLFIFRLKRGQSKRSGFNMVRKRSENNQNNEIDCRGRDDMTDRRMGIHLKTFFFFFFLLETN